ncbi:MAG: hypothetical protein WD049_02150 [Candidatus Paceibacterota bacterium]
MLTRVDELVAGVEGVDERIDQQRISGPNGIGCDTEAGVVGRGSFNMALVRLRLDVGQCEVRLKSGEGGAIADFQIARFQFDLFRDELFSWQQIETGSDGGSGQQIQETTGQDTAFKLLNAFADGISATSICLVAVPSLAALLAHLIDRHLDNGNVSYSGS